MQRRLPQLNPELAELLPVKARTFALASKFLPPAPRDATIVLYAFCRTMDDLVDDPAAAHRPDDIRARLNAWRAWLRDDSHGSSLPEPTNLAAALDEVLQRYQIPTVYLLHLLDGLETDLSPVRMPDFPALQRYCFQVAGTVGLSLCHVFAAPRAEALTAAGELGVAMQLTNILRDVGEDARANRVYLPADELSSFGYTPQQLLDRVASGKPDAQLRDLLRFQIQRARGFYARGLAGVWLLPPSCRLAILLAGRLYCQILDAIEASDYDVLRRRVVTSRFVKAREICAASILVRIWRTNRVNEAPIEHALQA